MTGIVDAFERWLPYPVYRFVGGPMDGKELTVTLIKMPHGMIAPPVWEVYDVPEPDFSIGAVANNVVVPRHRYRFVPANPAGNIGHYEHVPAHDRCDGWLCYPADDPCDEWPVFALGWIMTAVPEWKPQPDVVPWSASGRYRK